MTYVFKCDNEICKYFDIPTDIDVPMKDYDSVVPTLVCHRCGEKLVRAYKIQGFSTFNDGYKA